MKTAITRISILLVLSSTPLHGQTLTLLDAVKRAEQTHPSLELAEANIARASSGVREARAAWLPTLGLESNLTKFQEPMVVAPLHGFDPRNPPHFDRTLAQGALNAGFTLFDASRNARIDRARALQAAAQSGEQSARMQLQSEVARAYLQVQSAREIAEASQARVSALKQERDRAAQLVEQGRAARVVGLRAEAALSAATAESVGTVNDVTLAENELARLLGMSPDSLRSVKLQTYAQSTAAVPTAAELQQSARQTNPDLARARRQLAAAEGTRGEARGLYLPRFQLGGRYVDYASTKTTPQLEWQGSLQLSYPIFTGGTRAAANDRAAAEVQSARAELDLAQRRVDDALDRALSALLSAHARVTALGAAVAQSAEVSRIEKLALDTGAGVQTDYLNAEADLFRARASLTNANALELMARIELARLTGQLNEEWIARNVESHP